MQHNPPKTPKHRGRAGVIQRRSQTVRNFLQVTQLDQIQISGHEMRTERIERAVHLRESIRLIQGDATTISLGAEAVTAI